MRQGSETAAEAGNENAVSEDVTTSADGWACPAEVRDTLREMYDRLMAGCDWPFKTQYNVTERTITLTVRYDQRLGVPSLLEEAQVWEQAPEKLAWVLHRLVGGGEEPYAHP